MHSDLIDKLTSREREILTHIGEGESLAVIAKKLCRSLKTIESHRLSIGRKLKANNRVELAKIAIASGLVVLDGQQVKPGKTEPTRAQKWIGIINKAIHQATGRQLLERFCITASSLQGVDIAAICTCDPTQMAETCDVYNRVIMAVSDNGKLAKAMRYNAAQTPCQAVIGQGSLMMARGISDHYPNDPWLKATEAEGYLGMSLKNTAGESVGGVGLVSRDAIEDLDSLKQVIDFFNPQLAGAIQACVEVELLRSENDRLQAGLVETGVKSVKEHTPSNGYSEAYSKVTSRVHQHAGSAFLQEFVHAVCDEYGLFAGGICALDPSFMDQTLNSVSFCVENEECDTIQYQAKGAPCEHVLKNGSLYLVDGAAAKYPADDYLEQYKIRGFCGNRLPGPSGETAGVIWVVHKETLLYAEEIQSLFKHYAPRIGAELESFMQLDLLMQERERLEAQVAQQTELLAKKKTRTRV